MALPQSRFRHVCVVWISEILPVSNVLMVGDFDTVYIFCTFIGPLSGDNHSKRETASQGQSRAVDSIGKHRLGLQGNREREGLSVDVAERV